MYDSLTHFQERDSFCWCDAVMKMGVNLLTKGIPVTPTVERED